jgi:flagellar biosynthesis/type III secretory pathway chaperone
MYNNACLAISISNLQTAEQLLNESLAACERLNGYTVEEIQKEKLVILAQLGYVQQQLCKGQLSAETYTSVINTPYLSLTQW